MTAALLALAVLCGGTSAYPTRGDVWIELLAIAVLLTCVFVPGRGPSPWVACGLALLVTVPAIQLLALPPGVWSSLPGMQLTLATSNAIAPLAPRPITIDPEATLRSLLSLIPFIAILLATIASTDREQRLLLHVLLGLAGASLLLGMTQILTQDPGYYFYLNSHFGLPIGFFANRNHQGIFLAIAAIVAIMLADPLDRHAPRGMQITCGSLALVFAAGVIATGSRAASALLLLGVVGAGLCLIGRRPPPLLLGAALFAAALGAGLVLQSDAGARLADRFATTTDLSRAKMWSGARAAAKAHFPAGSGMGTFIPAFDAVEPLSTVSPHFANRAHNDYLELLVEAGALGLVGIGAFLVFAVLTSVRAFRARGAVNLPAKAAAIAVWLLLLHSLVDYPLRTPAMLATFALLCGLLARAPTVRIVAGGRSGPPIQGAQL